MAKPSQTPGLLGPQDEQGFTSVSPPWAAPAEPIHPASQPQQQGSDFLFAVVENSSDKGKMQVTLGWGP